jgi:hypothetical protein
MWGESWEKSKKTLDDFGFLEPDCNKIVLKPFLITYAEQAIDQGSKERFNSIITDYYIKKMTEVYK